MAPTPAGRRVYAKGASAKSPTPEGPHLVFKARKLAQPLHGALAEALAKFGSVEDMTVGNKGSSLFVTYASVGAARAAREVLSKDTACSALLGCGDRQGASVHFCVARDLQAEQVAAAEMATAGKPPGLHVLTDLLSEAEAASLVERLAHIEWGTNAGSRRVAHFGYTFSYSMRAVDFDAATPRLPDWTAPLLERIREAATPYLEGGAAAWAVCDQLTINEYLPGQGIAAHVETHSAFEDALFGISLLSGITMDFANCEHPSGEEGARYGRYSVSFKMVQLRNGPVAAASLP